MIRASLIYIGVTFLLALFDAVRIRILYGKVPNIDHKLSRELAGVSIGIVAVMGIINAEKFGIHWIFRFLIVCVDLVAIRFAFYDVCINFLRIVTKTNPTMRLDYMSDTTSSEVDRYVKLSFWEKRAIGVIGWVIVLLVYNIIF